MLNASQIGCVASCGQFVHLKCSHQEGTFNEKLCESDFVPLWDGTIKRYSLAELGNFTVPVYRASLTHKHKYSRAWALVSAAINVIYVIATILYFLATRG